MHESSAPDTELAKVMFMRVAMGTSVMVPLKKQDAVVEKCEAAGTVVSL